MSEPIEKLVGKTSYNPQTGILRVEVPYTDYATLVRRGYSKAQVILLDDRKLSDKQRKACYAMMNEIASYMGEDREEVKEFFKLQFWTEELAETSDSLFSMSDAPMSVVASFQRYLARFIVRHDIPTRKSLLSYVDDVQDYVYACLINKKCCICGKHADLHHCDRVGLGRNRNEIIHEGMRALPLCREHHTELHTIGDKDFLGKWHIDDGIPLDKTLCKIYGLKSERSKNGKRNRSGKAEPV